MKRAIVLVENFYEDLELWYPKIRLEEAGLQVMVAGPKKGEMYHGKHGYPCKADIAFEDVAASEVDVIVVPGGYAPDKIRLKSHISKVIQELDKAGKIVAFICHGGWVVISAKILKGRKCTSYIAIKDDMENAGAIWSDEPCVVDKNLISSRKPQDLPHFAKAILSKM